MLKPFALLASLVACGFAGRLGGEVDKSAPVVLPKVEVKASAPLIKVADYALQEERYQPAIVAQGNYLYVIGGSNSHATLLDSVERIDVRTGKSEEFATLGIGRRSHRAALIENRIYVLGGYSAHGFAKGATVPGAAPPVSFDVTSDPSYNPRLDERGAQNPNYQPDPEIGDYMKRSVFRDFEDPTHVLDLQGLEQSVEVIDLATRKISHATDLPDERAQFGCVVAAGKIYVIGGQRQYRHSRLVRTNTVKIFDPKTNVWSEGVPMPTPRDAQAALVDGGVIVVPGGYDGTRARTEVEVFNPADQIWRILPPLCRPTSAHSLVFLGHYLFLFGDYASPDELIAYDLQSKRSEVFTLQYKPARHTAAVVNDGKIYVVGGKAFSTTDPLNTIQVFALR